MGFEEVAFEVIDDFEEIDDELREGDVFGEVLTDDVSIML